MPMERSFSKRGKVSGREISKRSVRAHTERIKHGLDGSRCICYGRADDTALVGVCVL